MLNVLRNHTKREFGSLSEREILALAVAAEEEDGRIYAELASRLAQLYPGTAAIFEGIAVPPVRKIRIPSSTEISGKLA